MCQVDNILVNTRQPSWTDEDYIQIGWHRVLAMYALHTSQHLLGRVQQQCRSGPSRLSRKRQNCSFFDHQRHGHYVVQGRFITPNRTGLQVLLCFRPSSTAASPSRLFWSCFTSQEAVSAVLTPHPGLFTGVLANTTVYVLGIRVLLAGLTWAGVFNSWLLGCTIYAAFGIGGYLLVCLYFIIGSLVSCGAASQLMGWANVLPSKWFRRCIG